MDTLSLSFWEPRTFAVDPIAQVENEAPDDVLGLAESLDERLNRGVCLSWDSPQEAHHILEQKAVGRVLENHVHHGRLELEQRVMLYAHIPVPLRGLRAERLAWEAAYVQVYQR